MVKSYCLKKENLLKILILKLLKKENGRLMETSNCVSCGVTKARFIKMPV